MKIIESLTCFMPALLYIYQVLFYQWMVWWSLCDYPKLQADSEILEKLAKTMQNWDDGSNVSDGLCTDLLSGSEISPPHIWTQRTEVGSRRNTWIQGQNL